MGEGAAAGSRWERRASLAAAAVLALVALVEIDTARSLSVTCDEVSYLSSGYSYVARGAILMGPTHPPLAKLLGGATLRALGARGEWPSELDARPTDDWRPEWVYGERLLFADNSDFTFPGCARGADALVVAARLPNLVFPLLVAAIAYAWSRDRFGSWGGLVSLVLTATYPDLLGHGALVCSDVPLAAFALAAGFCVERLASGGGAAWLGALGLALGGALVSKATGVFVGPALLVVVLALLVRPPEALVNGPLGKLVTGPVAARVVRASLAGAVVCGVVLVVVWAAYLGANPVERYAHMLEHLRTHIPTRPSGYLLGLMGHRVWWFYLLVAVTLKLPLGTLALLGATALAARDARARGSWVREAVIHLPPLVIFVVLSLRALPWGTRYAIPVLPFLFVSAGRLAPWAHGSARRRGFVAVALAFSVVATVVDHPYHASSTNALLGSPLYAYKALDGSNQDWGGGLKGLAAWQRATAPGPLVVVAFTPGPYGLTPDRRIYVSSMPSLAHLDSYGVVGEVGAADALFDPTPGRVYAVSSHVVAQACAFERECARIEWPEGRAAPRLVLGGAVAPVALVGGGFLIFDLRPLQKP